MRPHHLASEASACRSLAEEFEGRPEAPLLLRIATEFDRLAVTREWPLRLDDEDGQYFSQRASQEVTAAVKAIHPNARLAHLELARRYEQISQAVARREIAH
jgi:TorA maturation chaperone TorD